MGGTGDIITFALYISPARGICRLSISELAAQIRPRMNYDVPSYVKRGGRQSWLEDEIWKRGARGLKEREKANI